MQSSKILWAIYPVLLSTSRRSQTLLELSKVLSDFARPFSDAPGRTCSYGGAFRMQRDVPYRIVNFWSAWELCADLWETSRAAETAAELCGRLWEHSRPLHSSAGHIESSRDHCIAQRETWCHILTAVVLDQAPGIWFYHIRLCYSHKIRNMSIWHALPKLL